MIASTSPRRAKLINGHGKCAAMNPRDWNSASMYQWNCNRIKDEGMLWSWNENSLGSGDRHICNGRGKCVASHSDVAYKIHLFGSYHKNERGQRFTFVDSPAHPGFWYIKNDHGKCFSIEGNSNETEAQIWANDCDPSEAGQRWKWHYTVATPLTPRVKLMNSLGKCAFVDPSREMNRVGAYMYQSDCNSTEIKAMFWSWNKTSLGSRDRHICNGMGLCVASNGNADWSNHLLVWDHVDERGQRFSFEDSLFRPGFYIIKNDHGKCLSVPTNENRNGAEIWASDCDPWQAGQHWKWIN